MVPRRTRYGGLARFFAFNAHERDLWVARQAGLVPSGSRVLDVGAGPRPYRELFRHCVYRSQDFAQLPDEGTGWGGGYVGIDYVSDIADIPVDDSSFDVVLCTEVLEHVPEPIAAVREIARVLRPGGFLILTAPQRSGAHQRPYHFYGGFTPEWYRHFLPKYGLEVRSIEPNGGFFKAYGEESQRFGTMILPEGWRRTSSWLWPAYVVLKLRAIAIALVCHWLDRYDTDRGLTVGHHVLAVKHHGDTPL